MKDIIYHHKNLKIKCRKATSSTGWFARRDDRSAKRGDVLAHSTVLLLVSLLIFSSQVVLAQIKIEAKLDSTHILIGDQTNLHIILTKSPSYDAVLPTEYSLGDSIEILDKSLNDTLQTSPNLVIQKNLLITSFDSGRIRIPRIPLQFKNPNTGQQQTIFSRPVFLNVATIALPDTAFLKPIKEIIEEPRNFEDYIPYIVTAGVVALAGLIIWWLIRGRQPKPTPTPVVELRPEHEIALEALQQLKKEELWKKGKVKLYQSQLTDIIREYLQRRYNIPAKESTSLEIIHYLANKDISTDQIAKLRSLFETADLVKFAKAEPPFDIHEQLLADATHFVEVTKYIPPVVDENATP